MGRDTVTLDGLPVVDTVELSREDSVDWKIADLHDQLFILRTNYRLLHPSEHFTGSVIAKIDRDVGFKVVKKVLYTAAAAGYPEVNFLVAENTPRGAR
ncbi:MAG: hypothetical protein EXR72_00420 [Myxococcales bacterium]|nr:hypothetical protein [Myxococcales bacterium]